MRFLILLVMLCWVQALYVVQNKTDITYGVRTGIIKFILSCSLNERLRRAKNWCFQIDTFEEDFDHRLSFWYSTKNICTSIFYHDVVHRRTISSVIKDNTTLFQNRLHHFITHTCDVEARPSCKIAGSEFKNHNRLQRLTIELNLRKQKNRGVLKDCESYRKWNQLDGDMPLFRDFPSS